MMAGCLQCMRHCREAGSINEFLKAPFDQFHRYLGSPLVRSFSLSSQGNEALSAVWKD